MSDIVEPAGSPRLVTLKHGDTFLVADELGDIHGDGDGLFHNDTRILSRFRLSLGERQPTLLRSSVSRDNVIFVAHLTNAPLPPLGGHTVPKDVIHLVRARHIWADRVYETVTLTSYCRGEALIPLAFDFATDFHDIFEVRGESRKARGRILPAAVDDGGVDLRYEGLDGKLRTCAIAFSPLPSQLTSQQAKFILAAPEFESISIHIEIGADRLAAPSRSRFRLAAARARSAMRARCRRGARLRSSDRSFNKWLDRSRADLALLTTELPTGPYPYAGVPWFCAPFGRDAIVTALQTLWIDPSLARGVLGFLASTQAQDASVFRSSAPGKILHETRKGEMTELGELPFGRYYGSADTTPLFVMLAGAYAHRTGDLNCIRELWPSLLAAMTWIEGDGDSNGDGFLDYPNSGKTGLANQGWKDSRDSVFHADGRFPPGPIAMVEVQGYAFAAFREMADMAERLGELDSSARWRTRAENLRQAVEARFWLADMETYAMAIDGEGKPCRIRSSNPGHLLYVGLPPAERGSLVVRQLASRDFNSGWGIRTLASGEQRFNPMSYHNGSVWPHDTALCVAGMARYGNRDNAIRLLGQMSDAAVHFGMRLPELYCGFPREANEPPVSYPVACLPQAWASGAVFMALQAVLGLSIDGWRGAIHIDRPALPASVDRLTIREISIGTARIDLVFARKDERVSVTVEGADRHNVPIVLYP